MEGWGRKVARGAVVVAARPSGGGVWRVCPGLPVPPVFLNRYGTRPLSWFPTGSVEMQRRHNIRNASNGVIHI